MAAKLDDIIILGNNHSRRTEVCEDKSIHFSLDIKFSIPRRLRDTLCLHRFGSLRYTVSWNRLIRKAERDVLFPIKLMELFYRDEKVREDIDKFRFAQHE